MRRLLLWILAIGGLFLPLVPHPPLCSGAYVQDVTTTGAVVAMITARPDRLSVQVWDPAGGSSTEVGPSTLGRWHALQITGLLPSRGYQYRVLDGTGAVLDQGSFRTAPNGDRAPVRFLVVGDSGGQPPWVWLQDTPLLALPARGDWLPVQGTVAALGAMMAADRPDFWLHVGDVIYPAGEMKHYRTGFFRPFADLLRQAPVYAILGNHDLYKGSQGRPLLRCLHLPTNPVTGDERLFSFAWGAVRVIGLDLNPLAGLEGDGGGYLPIDPDHPALVFLEAELERVSEPWIVVFSHYPYRSASRYRDRPDLLAHLEPLLREWGVDLYLAGHDHTYQRFGDPAQEPVLVVSGGGGKSLYDLVEHPLLLTAHSAYHYTRVEVSGPVLTLTAVGFDGTLDTVRLELGRDQGASERLARRNPRRLERIQSLSR